LKVLFFILLAGILVYLFLKFFLYLCRPFFLSRTFREIERIYNTLLIAVEKDVGSAVENLEKWRFGDEAVRMVYSENEIMESVNTAKAEKAHEEEVYGKFLRLKERFVLNPNKLTESIVVYRRYLEVRWKQREDAAIFANAVTLGAMSFDEMMAAAQETMIVLEESEGKLDFLLT
jgi:hypothetical protein